MPELERSLIKVELTQRREEGCDVSDIAARVEAALADSDSSDHVFTGLYDELMALQPAQSFPYAEPNDLAAIRAERPDGPRRMDVALSPEAVLDRIHGAWLGRAAGCSLGKPVEGWPRSRIDEYLAANDALPLNDYIPFTEGEIAPGLRSSCRGNIHFMARDDDMDFPILGLVALEGKGAQYTPRHMANVWLSRMPFHMLYTAENVAYRNFVNRIYPPDSGLWRNPYREWIGAQIRADIFGYVAPGWPEMAAELAYRDASISHTKNGIYGEMMMAAMIAGAFSTDEIDEIIEIGLSEIPANCRLAEAVRNTLEWCDASDDWEHVWDQINDAYGHYHGVHTINNAALVILGLKFGADDYERGIALTVRSGWDTDCNGATVGSILGARMGAEALPEKWVGVLGDRLMSCVRDFNDNKISQLAARTRDVAERILAYVPETVSEQVESREPLPASQTGGLPGKWELDLWEPHILNVDDNLTGKIESASGDISRLKDLTVQGQRVRFTFLIDKGGHDAVIDFDGNVVGDDLIGSGTSTGFEFEISGRRLSE